MVAGLSNGMVVQPTEIIVWLMIPSRKIVRPMYNHGVPNWMGRNIEYMMARATTTLLEVLVFFSFLVSGMVESAMGDFFLLPPFLISNTKA